LKNLIINIVGKKYYKIKVFTRKTFRFSGEIVIGKGKICRNSRIELEITC